MEKDTHKHVFSRQSGCCLVCDLPEFGEPVPSALLSIDSFTDWVMRWLDGRNL